MRRSHYANALILVSDHTKATYEDRWIGDVFHYTGMGLEGDQSLGFSQNKTFYNSNREDITLYLFEVHIPARYRYMGEVYLAGEPYQEIQPDKNGTARTVYVFPLKIKENEPKVVIPDIELKFKNKFQERNAERLNNDELKKRAKFAPKKPGTRPVSSRDFERNAYVSEYAKRVANGICQLCEQPAPFKDKKGKPYLETHHIIWLSKGGDDTIENTVALGPNCHRKMHSSNDPKDIRKLQEKATGN